MKVINVLAALAIVGISNVEAAESQDVAHMKRRAAPMGPPFTGPYGAAAPVARFQPRMFVAFREENEQILTLANKQQEFAIVDIRYRQVISAFHRSNWVLLQRTTVEYFAVVKSFHGEHYDMFAKHLLQFLSTEIFASRDAAISEPEHAMMVVGFVHSAHIVCAAVFISIKGETEVEKYVHHLVKMFTSYFQAILKEKVVEKYLNLILGGLKELSDTYWWKPTDTEVNDVDDVCDNCEETVVQQQSVKHELKRVHANWEANASGSMEDRKAQDTHTFARAVGDPAVAVVQEQLILNNAEQLDSTQAVLAVESLFNAGDSSSSSSSSSSSGSDSDDDDDDDQAATIIV